MEVRKLLTEAGSKVSEDNIVVTSGRVRAGDEIGEILFENSDPKKFKGILHIIGERRGATHHSCSVYITVLKGKAWTGNKVDHDVTKLVCNIADTALSLKEAAEETVTIIRELVGKKVNSSRCPGNQ